MGLGEETEKESGAIFKDCITFAKEKKNIAKKIKEKGKIDNVKKWGWDTNKEIQVRRYR